MATFATKGQLGARLAVCQAVGTIAGVSIAALIGLLLAPVRPPLTGSYSQDFLVALAFTFALNVPFYAAAVLILHAFSRTILARPWLWCVGMPALALAAALIAFPPNVYRGLSWIALIPLCAAIAGLCFVWWQASAPLARIRP